ncbi:hypothetical protein TNCV_3700051 [Trichonephila clavipes]|nr:hypothetical protein TNCV_3700051 [Trichonephila clavipes]
MIQQPLISVILMMYVENVAQKESIFSDDGEIDEIQCPSTYQSEVKWGKLYKKIDIFQILVKNWKVACTRDDFFAVPEKTPIPLNGCGGPSTYYCVFKQTVLLA